MTGGLLGVPAPADLADARLRLHHAALLASAVGRSLAPKEHGHRHAALFWDAARQALVGAAVTSSRGQRLRAEVRFNPPALALADPDPSTSEPAVWYAPLGGVTFDGAWQALRDAAGSAGIDAAAMVLKLPADLPDHPLRQGAEFAVDPDAGAGVGRWFDYADAVLAQTARVNDRPLPVPCWGDHFDLAVLVPMADDASITAGFSPGDASIPEPYLYLLPYPTANPGRLPGAPVNARWQTKGWVGLALTGSTIVAGADPAAMGRAFLVEGFEIASEVVLTPP